MVSRVYHVKEANDAFYNFVPTKNANQNVKIHVSRVVRRSVEIFALIMAVNHVLRSVAIPVLAVEGNPNIAKKFAVSR